MGSTTSFLLLGPLVLTPLVVFTTPQAQTQQPYSVASETAISRSAKTTMVAPANEKFAVMMSGTPLMQMEPLVVGGQRLMLSYYGSILRDSDYAVIVLSGLKDGNHALAQMVMLDYYSRVHADHMRKMIAPNIKATYLKEISLDGNGGKQFALEAFGQKGEWRIYRVGEKFYAAAASTNSTNELPLKRFFDSLRFPNSQVDSLVPTASTGANPSPRSPNRWMIILRTFSKQERATATRKMNLLLDQGFDVQVINTNSYPNLTPGLLALTMGPYSKQRAIQLLAKARVVAPQSYLKSGW
jgi:hypothetical protein